jgi:3-hydroxyisobutyrate dehydrogenase-like beta-hydroxyacid dehydrogenase
MGKPMAARLLRQGYTVVSCAHVRREAIDALKADGLIEVASPREVARAAAVVLTIVRDTQESEHVILGTHGVLAGMRPGAILVIMSTIDPPCCHRVAAAAAARGVAVLDAPVSGGASGAAQGRLALLVGGARAVIERARPILEAMGRLVLCGDLGMGMIAKLANNAVLGGTIALVAEALALAQAYGMPAASLLEVMRHSSGNSFVVHHWGELTAAWARHGLINVRKDVRLCLEAAQSKEVTMPLTAETSQYPWDFYLTPQR